MKKEREALPETVMRREYRVFINALREVLGLDLLYEPTRFGVQSDEIAGMLPSEES